MWNSISRIWYWLRPRKNIRMNTKKMMLHVYQEMCICRQVGVVRWNWVQQTEVRCVSGDTRDRSVEYGWRDRIYRPVGVVRFYRVLETEGGGQFMGSDSRDRYREFRVRPITKHTYSYYSITVHYVTLVMNCKDIYILLYVASTPPSPRPPARPPTSSLLLRSTSLSNDIDTFYALHVMEYIIYS